MAALDFGQIVYELKQHLLGFLKPDFAGPAPLTVLNRDAMSRLLPYRSFHANDNFVFFDDGEEISLGFGFSLSPMVVAGLDTESAMESVITRCPPDTMLQTAIQAWPDIYRQIDAWASERLRKTSNEILREMVLRRREFFLKGEGGQSLLPNTKFTPRWFSNYVFARIPYKGDLRSARQFDDWLHDNVKLRSSIDSVLAGAGLSPREMDGADHRRVLRQLLNPQFKVSTLDKDPAVGDPVRDALIRKDGRIAGGDGGVIRFEGGEHPREATIVSVDGYPETLDIGKTRSLTGQLFEPDDNIPEPYWAITNIHVMDPEKARDRLLTKLMLINRQTLSDSQFFRSMAEPLFNRRDQTNHLLGATENTHQLVRMSTAIVVYADVGEGINTGSASPAPGGRRSSTPRPKSTSACRCIWLAYRMATTTSAMMVGRSPA